MSFQGLKRYILTKFYQKYTKIFSRFEMISRKYTICNIQFHFGIHFLTASIHSIQQGLYFVDVVLVGDQALVRLLYDDIDQKSQKLNIFGVYFAWQYQSDQIRCYHPGSRGHCRCPKLQQVQSGMSNIRNGRDYSFN
jgi:hypothetical protein